MGGVKKCKGSVGVVYGVSVEGEGKSVGVRGSVKGGGKGRCGEECFLWGKVKGEAWGVWGEMWQSVWDERGEVCWGLGEVWREV